MAAPTRFVTLQTPEQPLLSRVQDRIGAVLNPLADAVGRTPIMGAPPPPWIRPTYLFDYVDAAGFQTAFHKDALGYVWVRLAAKTPGGLAALTNIFQFPLSYRPSSPVPVSGVGFGATVALVIVNIDGTLESASAVGAGHSVLASFSFLAEK